MNELVRSRRAVQWGDLRLLIQRGSPTPPGCPDFKDCSPRGLVKTVVIPGRDCDPAGGGLFAGLIRRQWPTGLYCGAASTCARDKPRQSTDLRRARIRSPARRDNEAMKLPVSAFDHRIVDGAQAAAFLCELRDLIESPELALLDL